MCLLTVTSLPCDLVVNNLCISFAFLVLVFLKKIVFGIEIFDIFLSLHHLHLVVSIFSDIARKTFPSGTHLFFFRLFLVLHKDPSSGSASVVATFHRHSNKYERIILCPGSQTPFLHAALC